MMKQENSPSKNQNKSPNVTDEVIIIKPRRGRPSKEQIQAEIVESLSHPANVRPSRVIRPPNPFPLDTQPLRSEILLTKKDAPTQSEVIKLSDLFICTECEAMFRTADLLRDHAHLHALLKSLISVEGSFRSRARNRTSSPTHDEECGNVIGCLGVGCTSSHVDTSNGDLSTLNNSIIENTMDVKLEVTSCDPKEFPEDVEEGDNEFHIVDESSLNQSSTMPELTCNDEPSGGEREELHFSSDLKDQSNAKIKKRKKRKLEATVTVDAKVQTDTKIKKEDKQKLYDAIVTVEGIPKYKCRDCERTFPQLANLAVHSRVHTGERPFQCYRCNYSFNVRSNLVVHLRTNVCTRRGSRGKKKKLANVTEGEVPMEEGDENDQVSAEEETEDPEEVENDDGDEDYNVADDLKRVRRTGKNKKKKNSKSTKKSPIKAKPVIQHFKVDESENAFDQAVWNAVSTVCRKRSGSERSGKVEPVLQDTTQLSPSGIEKRYSCQYCGRRFQCAGHVRVHERVHTGARPFVCTICSRPFSVASNLRTHMRAKHPEIIPGPIPDRRNTSEWGRGDAVTSEMCLEKKPKVQDESVDNSVIPTASNISECKKRYVCYICGSKFLHPETCVRHFARHMGAPSPRITYACEVCDATCASNANLQVHMRKHTGERPFTCDICGRSFAQSSHIRTHILTHSDAPASRDYVCDICGASYLRNYALKRHQISSHPTDGTNLHCEICDCAVGSKHNLMKHMNIIHGARAYVCMQCGRGYDVAVKLAEHELRHSMPKSHACAWCEKRYSFPGDLRKHYRLCHQNRSMLPDGFEDDNQIGTLIISPLVIKSESSTTTV